MLDPDPKLSEISLRNYRRVQDGYDRMIAGKAVQIEGVQFRFRKRCDVEGKSDAFGLVLVGRDERGEWLPAHS